MKDGSSYALDLTCAQHGYFEPLIPWEDYCKNRVRAFIFPHGNSNAFGQLKVSWAKKHKGKQSIAGFIYHNNEQASRHLKNLAVMCAELQSTTFKKICKMPEAQFARKRQLLLDVIEDNVKGYLDYSAKMREEFINGKGGRAEMIQEVSEKIES